MILLIDNYDSFSYNLYQLIGQVNRDIEVYRNDKITADVIKDLNPEAIILSPGPGRPEDAGIVADSVPDNEFDECLNKAAAVIDALKIADGGIL